MEARESRESAEGGGEGRLKLEVATGTTSSSETRAARDDASTVRSDANEAVTSGRPEVSSGTFERASRSPAGAQAKVKDPARELFALAWPIATAMLGETAIGLVDTKLVGGLGAAALGGVGVGTTLMYLAYSLVYGAMRGVKVRTAHAIGEGRGVDGFVYARAGMVIGFVTGIVVVLAFRDVTPVLRAIGVEEALVPHARDFVNAIRYGAPATCVLAALIQHRQAMGDARTQMIVGVSLNMMNALFAWTLIYGHFGLPALGVRGAGYATALAETIEVTVMVALLVWSERRAPERSTLSLSTAAKEVADLGVPTGLQFFTEMLAFAAFTAVLGSIGSTQVAGHQIALAVIRVSFLPGLAVSEAASVLVGRALGARNLPEADAVVKRALQMAMGFMALCGVGFGLFGGSLGSFFTKDGAVVEIVRQLLLVAALFQVLDAVNMVLRGSLRGAKDVRVIAVIGIGVVWTCIPTSAYVLGKLCGLGALGGWIGFVFETTLASALLWVRWKRGGFRQQYV